LYVSASTRNSRKPWGGLLAAGVSRRFLGTKAVVSLLAFAMRLRGFRQNVMVTQGIEIY